MGATYKVATFNIHHARGNDGIVDLRRIAGVLNDLGPDLIAMQELDAGTKRSGGQDQPEELADLLGMHIYFAPTISMDPGEYGIALASREEFRGAVEQLPRVGTEEPRVAIVAAWHKLGVVTTHLSRSTEARRIQTEHLADIAGKLGHPCLVLGDLNQTASKLNALKARGLKVARPHKSLLKSLKPGWPIDHILVSDGLRVSEARMVATDASDHPVLVADIHVADA